MIIIFVVLLLLAIPFVLAIFQKDAFTIQKDILINKPQSEVFEYLRILKNSDNYNKWVMTDPGMKKEFRGTDGTKGFVYIWDSENKQVGKGEQEITNISAGERIDYEIRFIKPFEAISTSSLILESNSENRTKVTWVFSGKKNYLMKLMHLLLNLSKMLAKDIETSLNYLKTLLEK